MTAEETAPSAGSGRSRDRAILAYISGVWALAIVLGYYALRQFGPPSDLVALVTLTALSAAISWVGNSTIEGRVQFAPGHLIVLAAAAILGPVGAMVVGTAEALGVRRQPRPRVRMVNTGMWASVAVASGLVYEVTGGARTIATIIGPGPLLLRVGLPLVAAGIAQVLVNAVLLAGILKVAEGIPARVQVVRLLMTTGLTYVGYGIVAFLLVVLWLPAGLGPYSVLLISAPLLGAWWAYSQYGEERQARERTLDVLVAAIETKAPHLEGHSARVAALSGAMAEELGLGPQEVRNARTAGMLHDIGQVALPAAVVLDASARSGSVFATYPSRGAHMLREVSFIAGALDGIAHHRDTSAVEAAADDQPPAISAGVVRVADSFDLLTRVGQEGDVVSPEVALRHLRLEVRQDDARIVEALSSALARRPELSER